ncbi:MAG: SPOR domain-containing protein [Acidobacteria bacterium]|nr:SPOR domain-containing protein [Acidobacteriota bacterium]
MAVGTRMAEQQPGDTEITLGTGKLLAFFFAAAVVCALFFGLGFNLGRASAPQPDPNVVNAAPTTAANGSAKPSATHAAAAAQCPAGQICSDSAASDTTPASVPPEATDAATTATADAPPAPEGSRQAATTTPAPPAASSSGPGTQAGSYSVQVAAVSRREDADALSTALRRKNYAAFVVNDPGDRLFHVQVGPFGDRKEAMDTRDRLAADGFNPIIK